MTVYDFREFVSTVTLIVGDRMRVSVASDGSIVHQIYGGTTAGHINGTGIDEHTLLQFIFPNLGMNMEYDIMFINNAVTTIAGYKIMPVIGESLLWMSPKTLADMFFDVAFYDNYVNRQVRLLNTVFVDGSYRHLVHVRNVPLSMII